MASKHFLSIAAIVNYFKDEPRIVSRGENALESGHVKSMIFDPDLMIVRGEVHASMKDKIYKVEISLNANHDISEAKCGCPRGAFLCHHMTCLALFAHYNISITDAACSWHPSTSKNSATAVKKIEEIFPPKKDYVSITRPVNSEDIQDLLANLSVYSEHVGFSWLLKKEPEQELLPLVNIEELLCSKEFRDSKEKEKYIKQKLSVNQEEIEKITIVTIGQSLNDLWLIACKHRLTASNFGLVLAACRKKRYSTSLFETLMGAYNIDGIMAIKWGRENEAHGREIIEKTLNVTVQQTGLWLHSDGVLGASPDGLINSDQIIEIKCPYKYRKNSLMEGLKHEKNYILMIVNNEVIINRRHNYYHQIQGTLHITGRKTCHLVIWTPQEAFVHNIDREEDWNNNLNILNNFYFNTYIPHIMENL